MTTAFPRPARPERRVWQLSGAMALVAVALALPAALAAPEQLVPTAVWFVLVPLFAVAEVLVVHLPTGRSSHSHVLREIPAVLGLAFLAPQQYVTAYVLGAGLALVLWSRVRGLKLVFNLALLALEATLGSLVFHAILGGADQVGLRAGVATVVAVLVVDLLSAAAVTAAIGLTESRLDPATMREAIRTGVPAALVNTCVALLLVTLVVASPGALPLLGALSVLLVLGYRVHVGLARGYTRLQLLYGFVGSTHHPADLDQVVEGIVTEAASLLHATRASLVVLDAADGSASRTTWDAGVVRRDEASPTAAWWTPALAGEPVLVRSGDDASGDSGADGVRDGIAVPMRTADEVTGVLLVSDRTFEAETFGGEDLKVFETIAAHAAVALDKARAVERLRRVAEERAHEATHDLLTGLLNRRAFLDAVEAAAATGRSTAVLLLDLDDFKDVNDTLGHAAGDRLLTVTADRLARSGTGTVARLGGDEFAVVLADTDASQALVAARALLEVLGAPVPLTGVGLTTSASIGVTTFTGSALTAGEALAQADVAMYAAKAERAGVRAYRVEDGHAITRRLALAADLQVALAEGALTFCFQPQASPRTRTVSGFEALLRWNHPQFGWVPPPEIVAVAHRTGLIRDLTHHVIERSLEQRARWAAAGWDLTVSVNVTPTDVAEPGLVDWIGRALTSTGTPPDRLVVELTETDAMGDPEGSLDVLTALHDRGVGVSIDDFGTGYSSLAYLDRLPVDEVKIDRSFITRLQHDAADSTIVRATVALAHDLGLRAVAEGVETDQAIALVAQMGCDLFQGYGLARPIEQEQVLGWLAGREPGRDPGRRGVRAADADVVLPVVDPV